ncbi:hypothetical protein GCM10027082_18990 [Comamonas humi]
MDLGLRKIFRAGLPHALAATLGLLALPGWAQVQRSFVNPSFETPALTASSPSNGCYVQLDRSAVPSWNTTHRSMNGSGNCASPQPARPGNLVELWRDRFNGVRARDGLNFAELNAEEASRIYQNICMFQGERVGWRFSHRGRNGANTYDRAQMKVGSTGSIVQVGTTTDGSYEPVQIFPGYDATAAVSTNPTNGWRDYSGQFTYPESSGTSNIGFEAVSGTTVGNFLDNIQIQLAPFVDFPNASSADAEGDSGSNLLANRPTLRINGTVEADFTVTIKVTGGTAQRGVDYFTNTSSGTDDTITITVPAGVYDGAGSASFIPLPVYVVGNTGRNENKTITFAIQPPAGSAPAFLLASNASCGAPVQTTWDYTIIDDDGPLLVTKRASAPVSVAGSLTQYDISYTISVTNPNSSGAAKTYTLVDTPSFEADARIDSLVALSCVPGSGANCGSGLLAAPQNGSGPWTLNSGRALGNELTDTYTLRVRFTILPGQAGPDACSSTGGGLFNSVSASVTNPASGDSASATACQPTPTPVWVTLRKSLPAGRINAGDQFQVRMSSGGIPVAGGSAITAAGGTDAATSQLVLPAGATLQFFEALKAGGTGPDQAPSGYRTALACTGASNAPSDGGTALATQQQWAAFTPAAGENLDCTITNTPLSYNVTATAGPGGAVNGGALQCNPSPVFPGGSSQCTAQANPGYSFAGWEGACSGQAAACALTNINADLQSHALFTPNPGMLTITKQVVGGPAPMGEMGFAVIATCTSARHERTVVVPANASTGSVEITGIPAGDNCTVQEGSLPPPPSASYQWATPELTQPQGAMAPGGSLSATVVNRLTRNQVPVTITKQVLGAPPAGAPGSYGFSLNCGVDGTYSGAVTLSGAALSGSATVSVPQGAVCSVLTETGKATAPDGYAWGQESTTAPGVVAPGASGTITNPLRPLPKVTATKAAVPSTLVVGATGQRYEIAVTISNGPTTAPITVADALPVGVTLSGPPTVGSGAVLGQCGNASDAALAAGCQLEAGLANGTYTITLPIEVAAAAAGGQGGNNRANLSGGGDPQCTDASGEACDPATPDVPVTTGARLEITKTNGVDQFQRGTTTSYTVTLRNLGGTAVNGVRWTDTAVSGLAEIQVAPGAVTGGAVAGSCEGLGCSGIALPAGASASYTVTAKVIGAPGSRAVNTARIDQGADCPASAACTATDDDPIEPAAPVPTPTPVPVGSNTMLALLGLWIALVAGRRIQRSARR